MTDNRHLKQYGVVGYGRVGSYTSARSGGRSRPRRCWMIAVWDDRDKDPDKTVLGKIGHVPVSRLGAHKTKKAAITALLEFAKTVNGEVTGDINGYPKVTVNDVIEPELSIGEIQELQRSASGQPQEKSEKR